MKSRIAFIPILTPRYVFYVESLLNSTLKFIDSMIVRETARSYSPEVSAFIDNLIVTKNFIAWRSQVNESSANYILIRWLNYITGFSSLF